MTADPDSRRATPLALKLRERIKRSGPITVAEYMDACLQDEQHGYYRTQAGIGRDFITSPEISQVFGELIGLWCAVVWQQMGEPTHLSLVELGPGRGTLMRDALRALRLVPALRTAAHVHLVESNAVLREAQRALLQSEALPLHWHADPANVPPGPAIVVGNEFLDVLPTAQYARAAAGWQERAVTIDADGALQFTTGDVVHAAVAERLSRRYRTAEIGDVVQDHIGLKPLAAWIGDRAASAPTAALLIDYGHLQSAPGDTLQALRGHQAEPVLTSPGEADVTVHVDFQAVAEMVTAIPGLAVDGPVTQAEFLGALGIAERASRLMAANPSLANTIEMGVQRLMAPHAMGTRFKAIGIRRAGLPPLPGLELRAGKR
jgi:SAM-dependent MidA family methyltransferase